MGDDFLGSEDRDEEKQHDLFIVNNSNFPHHFSE